MRNIFILYMPPGNVEAMVHYEDTIRNKVAPSRILPLVSATVSRKLGQVFGPRPIAVWGSRNSPANRARFDRMNEGDEILIVKGDKIQLLGRVAYKDVNPRLSQELWKNIHGGTTEGWDLIYFIANPKEIELPFSKFTDLFGYAANFQLRGFTSVASKKLEEFYGKYDDLYSILLRLKIGESVNQVAEPDALKDAPTKSNTPEVPKGQPEEKFDDVPSDHLKMQWLLLKLGRQAGEKVWSPRNDQSRISAEYKFSDFEETFAAGLDTQIKYVENIDVVWKEEFRIDAAFEIENTTSIYSGLLRFADLTMVAPNTVYPMFIVAPSSKRHRVREQLIRPSFRHLGISSKVRYVSYERVQEIDDFFGDESKGLSVDVFMGKSESLTV